MVIYIIIFTLLIAFLLVYFKIADHFNIVDNPNNRSSHTKITIRGGGIIFPLTAFIWYMAYGFNHSWIILAILFLSVISFLDDIITLAYQMRIFFHFLCVTILFWQMNMFGMPWYEILLAYFFTIGWINAFNFMDGINGITAMYSLTALISFAWLNQSIDFISQDLIIILVLSVFIFSFFNVRNKAITFAGDVGSISMAFLLAWMAISLIMKTGRIEYILFFAVYGIDTTFTIIYRLQRRENIFKAHRTHLYQYMSNELNWSHILVSAIYAIAQLGINIITIYLISLGKMTLTVSLIILFLLCVFYLTIRYKITKSFQPKFC